MASRFSIYNSLDGYAEISNIFGRWPYFILSIIRVLFVAENARVIRSRDMTRDFREEDKMAMARC